MAEITEVIHKISYEVNDDALENATKSILQQIEVLNKLSTQLDVYAKQLSSLSQSQTKEIDKLGKEVEQVTNKILKTSSKTKGVLDEVFRGILKGVGLPDSLKNSVEVYVKSVTKSLNLLEGDSKKAISGFAGHMKNASKAGKSSTKSLIANVAKLGRGLLSFTGIAGIAANVLIEFGTELFSTSGKAKTLSKEMQKAIEFANQLGEEAGGEISNLIQLRAKVEDTTMAYNSRNEALDTLRKLYPIYFKDLSDEEILAGKVAGAYEKITQSIITAAKARVLDSQLDEVLKNVIALEEKIKDDEKRKGITLDRKIDPQSGLTEYAVPDSIQKKNLRVGIATSIEEQKENYFKTDDINKAYGEAFSLIGAYNVQLKETQRLLSLIGGNNKLIDAFKPTPTTLSKPNVQPTPTPQELKLDLPEPSIEEGEEQAKQLMQRMAATLRQELKEQLADVGDVEVWLLQSLEEQYQLDEVNFEEYQKRKTQIEQFATLSRLKLEEANAAKLIGTASTTEKEEEAKRKYSQAKLNRVTKENEFKVKLPEVEDDKDIEKRKKKINAIKESYQELGDAVKKVFDEVYKAQISNLDKEIERRKEAVAKAEKLAAKGNSELLRIEEERLKKAEAARAQAAQKQIQLNAILQASNAALALTEAIVAVAKAAGGGDAYTVLPRIIAAVGGLVAGVVTLTNAFGDAASETFATGVVDYKGIGGPTDDKNWVRISSGESIITAEGTKKNRHLLEAINDGAVLHMLNPALPITMPTFKQPSITNNKYASNTDLKTVSKKLDAVVDAIEDNRFKQQVFFNEQGVGIMTERAIRKNKRRFK